jgi:hypothetical protein
VQVKIKEHPHKPFACSRFASLIQTFVLLFVPHNVAHLFHFVCFTSFSTARVSVSCLNTHTFPNPQNSFSLIFTCGLFAPLNSVVANNCRFVLLYSYAIMLLK